MALAAMTVAQSMEGARGVYVETEPHQLHQLHPVTPPVQLLSGFATVTDFVLLAGLHPLGDGGSPSEPLRRRVMERVGLTETLWRHQTRLRDSYGRETDPAKLMGQLRNAYQAAKPRDFDRAWRNSAQGVPFQVDCGWLKAELAKNGTGSVTVNGQTHGPWLAPDLAFYLKGGWFEELVLHRVLPLKQSGKVLDVRANLKLGASPADNPEFPL